MKKSINTFVITETKTGDEKKHIINEFAGKDEFLLEFVETVNTIDGKLNLRKTVQKILCNKIAHDDEYIIICEDTHKFTNEYSKEYLFNSIEKARLNHADVLFGGLNWFSSSIKIDPKLFWVENFSGTHFIILFKKFYDVLRTEVIEGEHPAIWKSRLLNSNKMFVYPFISVQINFDYSKSAQNRIMIHNQVISYYERFTFFPKDADSFEDTAISTYIINLPERKERLEHIKAQFEGKPEFETTVVEACRHEIGAYGLWQSIRKIIQIAISNEEDVIIICEDDHIFTEAYSKEYLFKNIVEAHLEGANYLSGGSGYFDYAIPVTENRYWVNHFLSAQFIVIYKRFFEKILAQPFNERIIADMKYSEMTSNKMVIYPFISLQKDFGYSDVTDFHNQNKGIVDRLFAESNVRFDIIKSAYQQYRSV